MIDLTIGCEISVIVPVYNEEEAISAFLQRTEAILDKIGKSYEIIFCLDPSQDNSQSIIEDQIKRNKNIKLLLLSRRFGQAAATMAGIHHARGRCAVTIDVDLQDPPELITEMYEKIGAGDDVVYSQRLSRKGETKIKLLVAKIGYRAIRRMANFSIPQDAGDYRMISRRVIDVLIQMKEANIYLRGLIAYSGFKHSVIQYHREARHQGKSKYSPFTGSISMGIDGVLGFTKRPINAIFFTAAWFLILSMLGGLFLILRSFFSPVASTSILLAAITFFSALILLALSIIGEYLGRIHDDVKHRPLYIIDKLISKD